MSEFTCERVIAQLVDEMKKVQNAKAIASTFILAFVVIDAMAHIARPVDAPKATGQNFKDWVDRYMHAFEPAEYRYKGEDLWGARCDILHTFSNQTRESKMNVGYQDGFPHRYRPDIDPTLVMLSAEALVDDLWKGVAEFVADQRGSGNHALLQKRFNELFRIFPFGSNPKSTEEAMSE